MLLLSHFYDEKLAEFDTSDGSITVRETPRREKKDGSKDAISGVYAFLEKHIICIYKHNGTVYLQVDGESFVWTDALNVAVDASGGAWRTLHISRNGDEIVNIRYFNDYYADLESGYWTTGLEEDFDFGAYLYRISVDADWRAHLHEAWRDQSA